MVGCAELEESICLSGRGGCGIWIVLVLVGGESVLETREETFDPGIIERGRLGFL